MGKLRYEGVEVAEGVFRFSDGHVNWYVIDDGGRLTVVDGGIHSHWQNLNRWLLRTRRSLSDIEAVLLTHGHADHMGIVRRVSDGADAPVHLHRGDEALAMGEGLHKLPKRMIRNMPHPHVAALTMRWMLGGVPRTQPVVVGKFFDHEDTLDVPGRPRVFHTPGHTAGSSCLLLTDRNVLVTGDALVTLDIVTGEEGMGIMPGALNDDPRQALDSLSTLTGVAADTILPGHGNPHRGALSSALVTARRSGVDWRPVPADAHGHTH
ncbi:MBL fold metallo-hydrolase [Streptomyces sp. NPDC005480]|uniref:MBL fold metallo-hydrolase n=1 Tax=Streptomyces sp. NPDC005480 TaxID=3154880 RepID=UPI0033AAF7AE